MNEQKSGMNQQQQQKIKQTNIQNKIRETKKLNFKQKTVERRNSEDIKENENQTRIHMERKVHEICRYPLTWVSGNRECKLALRRERELARKTMNIDVVEEKNAMQREGSHKCEWRIKSPVIVVFWENKTKMEVIPHVRCE